MSNVTAVILAAGQGKRMHAQVAKQYLILRNKPVLYYSLKAFEESCVDDIILVTGEGQIDYCRSNIINQYQFKKVSCIIEGGKERYDSVYKALKVVKDSDYILIHDGARPFISKELIQRVVDIVSENQACILGTPVKETIKVVNSEGNITDTPSRNTLWTAQTPQAFEYSSIKKAYDLFYREKDRNMLGITDDAMVYEKYKSQPVKMVFGDYNNIKITTPEDMLLAEEIFKSLLYK